MAINLDGLTLATVTTLVVMLSGGLLIVAWSHMRSEVSLLWMAAAHLVNGAATFLILAYYEVDLAIVFVGLMFSAVSTVFLFASARVFRRGTIRADLVALSALLVGSGLSVSYAIAGLSDTIALAYIVWVVLLCAASVELWQFRGERLPARWGVIALFLIHALLYVGGIYDLATDRVGAGRLPGADSWLSLMYFEGLLYATGTATLLALMGKERGEAQLRRAARTDGLTGASSRRAFFQGAERLLDRCRKSGTPLSVIVFDLDRFKAVNDSHGHHTGDRVLVAFADVVRSVLRPNDLFGRHGGEEFAIVLPGVGIETAYVIAERIRNAFGNTVVDSDEHRVGTTVSAGVATIRDGQTIQAAIDVADEAMYRAKNRGRNRVERAFEDTSDDDRVARIA